MYSIGIDVGSAYTKAVMLAAKDDSIDLIAYDVVPTRHDMRKGVLEVFEKTLKKGGISKEEV
ncbi:MAG: hypothetical protein QW365_07275, partial [Candidatus Nezhaarchaeales archaeon]